MLRYDSFLSPGSSTDTLPIDLIHIHPPALSLPPHLLPLPRAPHNPPAFPPQYHPLLPQCLQNLLLSPFVLTTRHCPPRRRSRLPLLLPSSPRVPSHRHPLRPLRPPHRPALEYDWQYPLRRTLGLCDGFSHLFGK